MHGSEAAFEAYDQVDVTLASGQAVRGRALKLSEAIRFMRLQDLAASSLEDPGLAAAGAGAIQTLIDEFPTAAELVDARSGEEPRINGIQLIAEVLPAFLFRSGTGNALLPTDPKTEPELVGASSSPSMT